MTVLKEVMAGHFPHTEEYKESIVYLIHGMYIDVYISVDDLLFTQTNDKKLINYLKSISFDGVSKIPKVFIGIKQVDVNLLIYYLKLKSRDLR